MVQQILKLMNANEVKAAQRKKYCEPPFMPTVPGPLASANIFIIENEPLIKPNPNPDTKNENQ